MTSFCDFNLVGSAFAVDSLSRLGRLVVAAVGHFGLNSFFQLDEGVICLFLIFFKVAKRAEMASVVLLTRLV